MQCPFCQAELRENARYCPQCGNHLPDVPVSPLDVIEPTGGIPTPPEPTGRFALGRQEDAGAIGMEASEWHEPMRLATTAWLVASAVGDTLVVFSQQDAIRQAFYPTARVARHEVTPDQALAMTQVVFTYVLAALAAWVLVKAVLAVGAYAGKTVWSFYGCLAVAGISGLSSLLTLAWVVTGGGRPAAAALLVDLSALALFGWMIAGLRRYGPWAARWVSTA